MPSSVLNGDTPYSCLLLDTPLFGVTPRGLWVYSRRNCSTNTTLTALPGLPLTAAPGNPSATPADDLPIALRKVFTLKFRANGTLERYKARLVAKGFTQTYRGEKQRMVCKLKKAIYGLKQSPRAWFDKFSRIIVYVDDILITGSDIVGIEEAKTDLQKHFVTKDLGRPRPDISFAIGLVSQFMDKPRSVHWETAQRILKYIKASSGKGLLFKRHGHVKIEAYSDADYAGAKDDRKSTSGYCTYVGENLVTWRSKKQNTVARSSVEAEYRAMAHITSEILWLKNLLKELGFMYDDPVPMHCDNQATIHISNNPIFHERTKHIDVDCHFVREAVMSQKICTPFTPSSEQRADIFTKALGGKQFDVLCNKLGMIDIFAPA
ncbi:UNVERIFIED_CONTAM: Retrovirus-related Pol polyprotein from transposon RE2 [Sesamum angustifolium]|uniref:Retrovirus-related Pol polyprotein from transposon RE2 n=1 Tax=Sesamum angustifolium TaxID=2727405 RepID=A0AAW2IVJ1_9LAMI